MTARFGHLGCTLDSLARSGFANRFQLEPTGEAAAPGWIGYRPGGPDFRALVALSAEAPSGALRRLELRVARSFIDDVRPSVFARDIIKSFVEAVASTSAAATLAQEIMFRNLPGPILMRGGPPPLDDAPSPAFLAVAGRAESALVRDGSLTLLFVNEAVSPPHLAIRAGFD